MKPVRLFIALISFFPCLIYSQDILPFVENFSKADYNGDNQIWNITKGSDNAMYFANNRFLLQYNGASWRQYLLPYKTIIRSVFSDKNRIYTGSYNEFGYWERNAGDLVYHSLSTGKSLFKGSSANEEIWKIFRHKDKIYFQSFNEMYEYDQEKGKIEKIRFPSQVSYCYVLDDEIIVPTVNSGIYIFSEGKFVLVKPWRFLKVIHAIGKINKDYYFFTKKDGVFKGSKTGIIPWEHRLNEKLRSSLILSAAILDNTLIIGTSASGIYIVDLSQGTVKNINKENSLQNNTILSVHSDSEKDLWLGLDNGISHIELNSPFSFFTDPTGILGTVYSIVSYKNGYVIGSNHGVFTLKDGKLEFIEGSEGQVWDLYSNEEEIIIGHNDGTFLYRDSKLTKVNTINGGWNFFRSEYDNCFYQSNYSGIVVYKNIARLNDFKILKQITKPLKSIVQNKKGILYVADNYRGVFRLDLDDKLNIREIKNLSLLNNIENDFDAQILKLAGKIFVFVDRKWYEAINDKLVLSDKLTGLFDQVNEIIPVIDSSVLILNNGLLSLVKMRGSTIDEQLIPLRYFNNRFVNKYSRAFIYKSELFLNLDDGFLIFDTNTSKKQKSKIWINAYCEGKYLSQTGILPYRSDLDIEVLTDHYGYNKPELFYSYQNSAKRHPVFNGHIVLNKLSSGNHQVNIYYNENGEYIKALSYRIKVARPWFLSSYMILAYISILGFILYLYYRWNHIRFKEKLKIKKEELRHQQKVFEMEMETKNAIQAKELEKHLLEVQVQNKASEVAVKSLSLAKQTEMIRNIEDILKNEKNIEILKSRIKKIIKIASMDENVWKSFEEDLIRSNKEFVEKLIKNYPFLSSKDLKLCIYLRMNLSSKEIAPLMNISFRSVELHRYRLRKKLGIGTEVSLNNLMLNIQP